jgi:hypothetical protein
MKCITWVTVGLAVASCDPSPACDPGQRAEIGGCFPIASDGSVEDAGTGSFAPDASDEDAGALALDASCTPGPGNYDGFGDSCMDDGDCSSCIAPTCTGSLGMCSRLDCQTDDEACPPGWQCTDISAFSGDPNVTHICLET